MYFERLYVIDIGLYKFPCSSRGVCHFFFYNELYEFSITSSREFYGRNTYVLVQKIYKKKNLLRRSLDSWELFGGKIGGGRVPPSDSRTLAVLGWWSLTFQWSTHRPWAGD